MLWFPRAVHDSWPICNEMLIKSILKKKTKTDNIIAEVSNLYIATIVLSMANHCMHALVSPVPRPLLHAELEWPRPGDA